MLRFPSRLMLLAMGWRLEIERSFVSYELQVTQGVQEWQELQETLP